MMAKTKNKRATGSRKKSAKKPGKRKASKKRGPRRGAGSRRSLVEALAERMGEHRAEILDLYRRDLGIGTGVSHDGDDEVDRANFDTDRELALALSRSERDMLLQIEEALERIDQGKFGDCVACTKPIGEQRLQAIPWARYCIECQELEEKGLLE